MQQDLEEITAFVKIEGFMHQTLDMKDLRDDWVSGFLGSDAM